MRQIMKELWIENSPPAWLLGKGLVLSLMLFNSFIIRDFPYGIQGLFIMTGLELAPLKMYGQIEYIIPQTRQEKKRRVIIKSVIISGLYTLVNTAGYVLFITRSQEHHWRLEIILFFLYMTVAFFLYIFNLRINVSRFGDMETMFPSGALSDLVWNIPGMLLAILYPLCFLISAFGHVRILPRAQQDRLILECVISMLSLVLLSGAVMQSIKEMDFSEYRG